MWGWEARVHGPCIHPPCRIASRPPVQDNGEDDDDDGARQRHIQSVAETTATTTTAMCRNVAVISESIPRLVSASDTLFHLTRDTIYGD